MKTPDIKHNPHPKMRYEITLTLDEAPGPFESVEGYAYYEVINKECSPENPISGTWGRRPITSIPFSLTRTTDDTYTGSVYLDQLQDADYFGLGLCHWSLNAIGADLQVGAKRFGLSLSLEELLAQHPVPRYFARSDYEGAEKEGSAVGSTDRAQFKSASRIDIFSISLNAKEAFQ